MSEALVDALKKGIKGEMDSITLYKEAAQHTQYKEVQDFFLEMAEEETNHYNWLVAYYKKLHDGLAPASLKNIAEQKDHSPIVTDEIVKRIAESQYVTTALASALLLEATALRFYADSAEKTIYPELQAFFTMLSEWERKHYNNLIVMEEEAERYWFDLQRFEPF